jgi:hypothetical protein
VHVAWDATTGLSIRDGDAIVAVGDRTQLVAMASQLLPVDRVR